MDGLTTAQRLQLGVEAARAGQSRAAIHHLRVVLAQEPQNIPAMLWLASLLPSPQDSLYWLEQVLRLDPANERARAGLRWARGRLGLPPPEFEQVVSPQPSSAQTVPTPPHVSVQPTLPSRPLPTQSDFDEPVKQKRRSAVNPLLLIIFLVSGLIPLSIGLGVLALTPADTLAAWFPVSPPSDHRDMAESDLMVNPIPPAERDHLAGEADRLTAEAPQTIGPVVISPYPPEQSAAPEAAAGISTSDSLPVSSTDPALLIGPDLPLAAIDRTNLAHQPAYPGEKWIEVNVTSQQVIAWEGDLPVMAFKVSTGQAKTPTILGEFYIYWKLESGLMAGPGYALPEVPYIMYFYEGYALHGTYWHNYFGYPISRGCVNLRTQDAKKLFEWAGPAVPSDQAETVATYENPGTLVVVHE